MSWIMSGCFFAHPFSLLLFEMTDIKKAVLRRREEIFAIRRDLHQIPEPAFTEEKTARYVAGHLANLGLEVQTGIAKFGIKAGRVFSNAGKTLMLRSELDALRVAEETGLDFASTHPGAMHACGHDGHMAMVLGAAMVLADLDTGSLSGGVNFVFQPAEEGPGGAKPMIEQGVMDNPPVDYSLGCHLWPGLPLGSVGISAGPVMAAMDRFDLTITGKGGHGAMPHLCVDALETATQVVSALQRLVSRKMDPTSPSVVTVGQFNAGTAFNVIAHTATLSGTTRTFDPKIQASWEDRIKTIARGVCDAMGADFALDFQLGYPVTVNDQWMAEKVRGYAAASVGGSNVKNQAPTMGGEDMAYFLERSRGCYFFIGVGENGTAPLHSPRFDFDPNALLTGVEIYCRAVLDLLGGGEGA